MVEIFDVVSSQCGFLSTISQYNYGLNQLQEAIQEIQIDISNLTQTLSKKDKQLNEAQKIIEEEREKETTLISYPLLVEGERIPKELNRLVGFSSDDSRDGQNYSSLFILKS